MNESAGAVLESVLSSDQRSHYQLAWLSTVDHKRIGILYMLAALVFFIAGGTEALLMRLQLAVPNNHLVGPDTFNMLFTMHGTTMIFLVVMPLLFGLANYFVPLQIGARDMAFPRLNAFSFWLVPFGGILLHFSLLIGDPPMVGWFAYAPLNETPYSSRLGVDYWAVALLVLGIGSVGGAINLLTTILCLRAPGMTLRRLPLFTWMNFINSFLILFAIPVLNAGLVMLLIDRRLDSHFFLPAEGGSPILWQHIFWAFGHPEVYILALPAFGMVSEIIPVFSRKPIFGYEFVAGSTVAIALLSVGVWAHHMFTVGLGHPMDLFFAGSTMLIAIPTGVKVLNWSATMYRGRIRLNTPMLYCIAFLVQFLCGGISGVSHAIVPLDWQTKNSYYLVAHFHYVAVGGILFANLAAIHYWFPKMSGRMLSEKLGRLSFWLMVVGFNGTFMIQHFLGLAGMGRRIYTYPDLPGWGWMNMLSTVSAFFMAAGSIVILWNIATALLRGPRAGNNPWDAWTLEWATTSPPPEENFEALPPIHSRRPLWDDANPDRPDPVVGPDNETAPRIDKNLCAMIAFVLSEAGFFGTLILAFLYYNVQPQGGPSPKSLDLLKTGIFSLFLFASSFTMWRSEKAMHRGSRGGTISWLVLTITLGAIFIGGQALEYGNLLSHGVLINSNLFATTFFTLTGFHGIHVVIGLLAMLIVLGLALAGDFAAKPPPALMMVAVYWHFVDIVWVFVLTVVYILPHFFMNAMQFLTTAWAWSPIAIACVAAVLVVYFRAFGWSIRACWMLAAAAICLVTLISPLAALAEGYLFSAHMLQHILLVLVVPAFALMALPAATQAPSPLARLGRILNPAVCWSCGVGAMWVWHAPALCNAAATSRAVSALQTLSLLVLGAVFWWQLLAPVESKRIAPLQGVVYLSAACAACTILGIILTFSPVTVCRAYLHPVDRLGIGPLLGEEWGMTPLRDQQIGGLIMWVPMCLVYLGAIFGQLARWYSIPAQTPLANI